MDTRNEMKADIMCKGMTMRELTEKLSGRLRWASPRCREAVGFGALGHDMLWRRRKEVRYPF